MIFQVKLKYCYVTLCDSSYVPYVLEILVFLTHKAHKVFSHKTHKVK